MARSSRAIPLLIAVLSLLGPLAPGKDYTVFSGGKSGYSIVVSSKASESEKYAAQELQSCIEAVGRVKLPVVDCGQGRVGSRIIIGYNRDSERLFPQEPKRQADDESFVYKNQSGDIVILGGGDRGTMYGVFSFLENELGCHWLAEDCTVLPSRSAYSFSSLDHSESPVIARRSILYSGIRDAFFRTHCRINERIRTSPAKPIKQIGGDYSFLSPHTMAFLLPAEKYYDSHPEYFALVDGKRINKNTQPCFSNPAVLSICINQLREIMRTYPEFSIYEVSALDNDNRCFCDKCNKRVAQLGSYTDLVLDFVNHVVDGVKREFPDKYIEFLAYGKNTSTAPISVIPRENVVIRLSDIGACRIHGFETCNSSGSAKALQALKQWRRVTDRLVIWDYVSDFSWYHIPFPNFYAIREDFQTYDHYGIDGIFIEGNHTSPQNHFQALRIYVVTKLLWNPYADLDAIVNEFLEGYYGSSAKFIRQYFDLIHAHVKPDTHLGAFAKYYEDYYSEELVESALRIFTKAKKAADNEVVLRRVEQEEFSVRLLWSVSDPKAAVRDGSYEKVRQMIEKEEGLLIGSASARREYNKRISPHVSDPLPEPEPGDSPSSWSERLFSKLRSLFL